MMEFLLWKFALLILLQLGFAQDCRQFQPFRVQPENAKYQLGAVFGLHKEDCAEVRPEAVQELVAVQWALTHWNTHPDHARVALYAADSCSRSNASVSQVLSYLEETGRFAPEMCPKASLVKQLGVILPTDVAAAATLSGPLKTFNIPSVAYSTASADAHLDAVSVVPRVKDFVNIVTTILSSFHMNYVSILTTVDYAAMADRARIQLSQSGIFTEGIMLSTFDADRGRLVNSESNVVMLLMTKQMILDLFESSSWGLGSLNKLYILIPTDGGALTDQDSKLISTTLSQAMVVVLQQPKPQFTTFRAYFLNILKNNYQAYPLFAAYMEHVYGCKGEECQGLTSEQLVKDFVQSPRVEGALLSTYTFLALVEMLERLPDNTCAKQGASSLECQVDWRLMFESLSYKFGDFDPQELRDMVLSYPNGRELYGSVIQAFQLRPGYTEGVLPVKLVEHAAGMESPILFDPSVVDWPGERYHDNVAEPLHHLMPDQPRLTSRCPRYRPSCHYCPETVRDSRFQLHKHGDIYVAGFFDWHEKGNRNAAAGKRTECGTSAGPRSIVGPISFIHTMETFKERFAGLEFLEGVEVGALLLDTCQQASTALREITTVDQRCLSLQNHQQNHNVTIHPELISGYIVGVSYDSYSVLKDLFTVHGMDAALGTAVQSSLPTPYHVFSLMPTYYTQAKAIVNLLLHQGWNYVSVIVSEEDLELNEAFKEFKNVAENVDICIANVVRLSSSGHVSQDLDGRKEVQASKVSVVFAISEDISNYVRGLTVESTESDPFIFVLVGDSHNWDTYLHRPTEKWRQNFYGSISIQPKLPPKAEELREFLSDITPRKLQEPWFLDFWEDYFQCSILGREQRYTRLCEGSERFPIEQLGRLTKESYLMMSVEHLLFHLDALYRKYCPQGQGLCEQFYDRYTSELPYIMSRVARESDFDIYNYVRIGKSSGYKKIGNWSQDKGVNMMQPHAWYIGNERASQKLQSHCRLPLCRCKLDKKFFSVPLQDDRQASESLMSHFVSDNGAGLPATLAAKIKTQWHQKTWSYIFLAIVTILLLAAIGVLLLIVVKVFYRVIKGNQGLGICLLLGVILIYATGYFFVFDPSDVVCRLRYAGHSFSYAVCFGVMIVKSVQLRNTEVMASAGVGLGYWNYWILLFFILTVQLALNVQWALFNTSAVHVNVLETTQGGVVLQKINKTCVWSVSEFLASQSYVLILLAICLFIAVTTRNVKRNYKESRWLLYTTVCCVPIWIAWMVAFALTPEDFRDTVIVMELIACGSLILCFMFGPKIYILLSYEPVLVNCNGQQTCPTPTSVPSKFSQPLYMLPPRLAAVSTPAQEEDSSPSPCPHSPVSVGSTQSTSGGSEPPRRLHSPRDPAEYSTAGSVGSADGLRVYATVVRKKSRSKRLKLHNPHGTIKQSQLDSQRHFMDNDYDKY